jgi:hypothetical protein
MGNLAGAAAMIDCHRHDFALCFASSTKMLAALAKAKAPPPRALVENTLFHALSGAALGKYDVYDADIKKIDALVAKTHVEDMLAPFKTVVEQARAAKLFITDDHASELSLGTYHLLGGKAKVSSDSPDALVTLRFVNQDKTQRDVKVTVEIAGVTDAMIETVALPPGKQITKLFTPPLKMSFDVTKLRATRASQIAIHIVDPKTNASLLDKNLAIDILPRDHLPLRRFFGAGGDDMRTTFDYAAAWITPNAPEIDAFIKKAKARLPAGNSFSGMQQGTLVQVKAIYDELKAHGVSYVEDPDIFDERASVQRTRLPAEVLASTNAQCLEGTLLYATLFEAIGLQPLLIFKKGHAFVAWKPSQYDKQPKIGLFFLETTLTGNPDATFEIAVDHATQKFIQAANEHQFDRKIGAVIDVSDLRAKGYTPQPY